MIAFAIILALYKILGPLISIEILKFSLNLMKITKEVHYAFLHHHVLALQCQTMIYSKGVDKPMEKAPKSLAELTISLPYFLELFNVDIIAC